MPQTLDQARSSYIDLLSSRTGLDPRVLDSWIKSEGHPGDEPGYFNWMNIKTSTAQSLGIPTVGTGPAGTAQFGDLGTGVTAAYKEIVSPAIGLTNEKGKSPQQQITDIAASGWAESHYGGPGGPNLVNVFAGAYGAQALSGSSVTATPSFGDVVAAGGKGSPLGGIPGGGLVIDAKNAVTGPLSSAESALQFLFSYRMLEILGGGVLVIIGLVALAREVGVSTPKLPGPVGTLADLAVIEGQRRRGPPAEKPEGFEPESQERDRREARSRRGSPGSSQLARGESLPF